MRGFFVLIDSLVLGLRVTDYSASMYDPEDNNTEVLYFKNAKATFSSFTAAPETVEF